jgi:hypothetical protein
MALFAPGYFNIVMRVRSIALMQIDPYTYKGRSRKYVSYLFTAIYIIITDAADSAAGVDSNKTLGIISI